MRPILFLLLALPAFAFAGGPGDGGPRGHRGPPPAPHELLLENADTIGLDDATAARVEAVGEAAAPELEALHDQLHALDRDDPAFDTARAELVSAEKALMEALRAEMTEAQWEAAKDVLPPPRGERGGRGRGGEGRGGHGPGGHGDGEGGGRGHGDGEGGGRGHGDGEGRGGHGGGECEGGASERGLGGR